MPFDFNAIGTPFRMQPGLRRLAAGDAQLTPNRPGDRALREKLAVLGAHADQALLSSPGFDAQPALRALFDHAAAERPDTWRCEHDGGVCAPWLGWRVRDGQATATPGESIAAVGHCLAALPPDWRATALLCLAFAEDFALIDGTTAVIPWLAVCLPSHWAPEAKIGRHFADVHAPVADNETLVSASAHLARLVTGSDRWERQVWTVTPHPDLQAHPARLASRAWPADADADALAAQAWFRTERQTFIPVASQRQAVFTIHVECRPLVEALARPADAQRVHDALHSMSDAVLAYRGLTAARDRLLAWLRGRVARRAP